MYEAHFRLPRRPFLQSADTSRFFAPERIQEIVRELATSIEQGHGVIVLSGPLGVGKTVVCRKIAADLAGCRRVVHVQYNGGPSRRDLLESLHVALGGRETGPTEPELRRAVCEAFEKSDRLYRGAVVIIDDAHHLSEEQLDEVRCLAGPSTGPVRVMLAGQSSLEQRLTEAALEKLNQQVISHLVLEPWSEQQSIDYIKFQIDWAGGRSSQIFTPRALERIALLCGGLPRCLDVLGDHVLLVTYAQEQTWITEEAVDDALIDVQHVPLPWNLPAARQTVN
jgi:MSHA biogenesis protein MshM